VISISYTPDDLAELAERAGRHIVALATETKVLALAKVS